MIRSFTHPKDGLELQDSKLSWGMSFYLTYYIIRIFRYSEKLSSNASSRCGIIQFPNASAHIDGKRRIMIGEIIISALQRPLPEELDIEIAERKGAGHPDTLCDLIAEETSRALCLFYIDEAGAVMHHNVDKALLVGGEARSVDHVALE